MSIWPFSSSSSSSAEAPTAAAPGVVSLSPDRRFWTSIHDTMKIDVFEVSEPVRPKITIGK